MDRGYEQTEAYVEIELGAVEVQSQYLVPAFHRLTITLLVVIVRVLLLLARQLEDLRRR